MPVDGAIQTRYAGCYFRSRLEARWAVFYDALDIRWEYEPQGFDLNRLARGVARNGLDVYHETDGGASILPTSGLGSYLPDFWLPTQQTWIEVKGERPEWHSRGDQRLNVFGRAIAAELVPGRQFVVCVGGIPRHGGGDGPDGDGHAQRYGPYWDNFFAWNRCRRCGSLDVTFEGRAGRNYCGCEDDDAKWSPHDDVLRAYVQARSARFEFGETP